MSRKQLPSVLPIENTPVSLEAEMKKRQELVIELKLGKSNQTAKLAQTRRRIARLLTKQRQI